MSQVRRLVAAMLALSLPLAALAQTASTPPAPAAEAKAEVKAEAKPAEKKPEGVQVKPYGFVLGNLYWNTETFAVKDYPGQVAAVNTGGAFIGSARQSRFGVRLSSTDPVIGGATLAGVIEFDFNGGHVATAMTTTCNDATPPVCTTTSPTAPSTSWYNGLMRLRLAAATATWKVGTNSVAVMVGQEYGLVNPLFATSLAYVASPLYWQAGNLWRRAPQARVTWNGNFDVVGLSVAGAILSPMDGAAPVDFGAGNRSRRPDLEGRVALSVKPTKDINATLGVGYHTGTRRFATATGSEDETTSLIGVDLEANLTPFVLLRGEWYMGEGVDDTYAGIFSPGVQGPAGDRVAVASDGYWAQAVVKPTELVWVTAGYGVGNADEDDLTAAGAAGTVRTENSQLSGGVILNAAKAWKLGLEVVQTKTTYLSGADNDALQLAFSSQLIF